MDSHIDTMVSKISAKIGILRSLRKIVPTDTLKLLYNAVVQPHFDYADIVYDSTSSTNKQRLQRLQTRAARLISGTGPRDSRIPMFQDLGWLSLQNRRNFHKLVMVYKCINGLVPSYLSDIFNSSHYNHGRNTRNSDQLRAPRARTAYYQAGFVISGHKLWNDLPSAIRESESLPIFKRLLYTHYQSETQF